MNKLFLVKFDKPKTKEKFIVELPEGEVRVAEAAFDFCTTHAVVVAEIDCEFSESLEMLKEKLNNYYIAKEHINDEYADKKIKEFETAMKILSASNKYG